MKNNNIEDKIQKNFINICNTSIYVKLNTVPSLASGFLCE
jgi:hypothetical protein